MAGESAEAELELLVQSVDGPLLLITMMRAKLNTERMMMARAIIILLFLSMAPLDHRPYSPVE